MTQGFLQSQREATGVLLFVNTGTDRSEGLVTTLSHVTWDPGLVTGAGTEGTSQGLRQDSDLLRLSQFFRLSLL